VLGLDGVVGGEGWYEKQTNLIKKKIEIEIQFLSQRPRKRRTVALQKSSVVVLVKNPHEIESFRSCVETYLGINNRELSIFCAFNDLVGHSYLLFAKGFPSVIHNR
jgi:hypothetical protein